MTDNDLNAARDDVYRKIGRNVYAFQKMEAVIKFLIARGQVEGPFDQVQAIRTKAAAKVRKKTMGALIEPFVSQVYSNGSPKNLRLEGLDKNWISVSYKVEADQRVIENRKNALAELVSERNRLVHHMIAGLDVDSMDSCVQMGEALDRQYEQIRPEYEDLHSMMAAMQSGMKELADRLMAGELTED